MINHLEFRDKDEYIILNHNAKISLLQKMKLSLSILNFKRIKLCSDEWQMTQAKLSLLPDWGYCARKRNAFYMVTANVGKRFYAHSGISLMYAYNITIGDNVSINHCSMISAREKITIGNNVLIGPFVTIISSNHEYKDRNIPICYQGHKDEPIVIEDDVWIGANAVILPGVTIHKGSIVAAGTIVTKDIQENSIVGGVPAKKLYSR